jgi:hypothetical protein
MNKTDLVGTNGTVSFHWTYQFSGLCVASVHSERSVFVLKLAANFVPKLGSLLYYQLAIAAQTCCRVFILTQTVVR